MRIDTNSLLATLFLTGMAYMILRSNQGALYSAVVEIAFLSLIVAGLYFSYRLLAIIRDVV